MGVASSLTIWVMTERFIRLHEEKYAAMNPFWGAILHAAFRGGEQRRPCSSTITNFGKAGSIGNGASHSASTTSINFKILQTDQRIGWWAAHRLEDQPRYADADVRLVTLLSPHVCRAITISDALNLKTIRSEALEATLNALTSGVYLVDSSWPHHLHEPSGRAAN